MHVRHVGYISVVRRSMKKHLIKKMKKRTDNIEMYVKERRDISVVRRSMKKHLIKKMKKGWIISKCTSRKDGILAW
jgi:hypothetical protein